MSSLWENELMRDQLGKTYQQRHKKSTMGSRENNINLLPPWLMEIITGKTLSAVRVLLTTVSSPGSGEMNGPCETLNTSRRNRTLVHYVTKPTQPLSSNIKYAL